VNTEAADMRLLVLELLKKGEESVRRLEFSFQQIVIGARSRGLRWALEGKRAL